jgi:pimeloyl-ACP methyl ester carboxylesterase
MILSKVDPKNITQLNVVIGQYQNEDVYIRTNVVGELTKPILVFIHGYASSGPLFFKIMRQLIKYFCVIFIDIIGMGGSARPDDFNKDEFTP